MLDEILAQFDHVCFIVNDFKMLEISEGMGMYIKRKCTYATVFDCFIFLQCLMTVLKALDDVMFLQMNEWCFAAVGI
jgi:hypothetical protein